LFDTSHVPKPLSQQLLQFGRSGDGLEVLTFGVELFLVLSARRGRSVRGWRTVRERTVRHVFIMFLLAFFFDLLCFRVLVGRGFGRSACAGRTVRVCLADSPRAPRGRSVVWGRYWRFCLLFRTVRGSVPDDPWCGCGQSAAASRTVRVRTVRPFWPDCPPEPGCFVPWFDSSLLLSCFRVCFKESFLRLEVDP
jgi:hypothetical protein